MSTELHDLLDLASSEVHEVDLAERAWTAARVQRRTIRRRVLLGAGGLAAAGAAVAVVVGRRPATVPVPAGPTPAPSGRLEERTLGRVRVALAPGPAEEAALPRFPQADRYGFTDVLGTGEGRPRSVLAADAYPGTDADVRAVFLVVGRDDTYQPVVYLPLEDPSHLLVPAMTLVDVHDASNRLPPRLGPRTISDDRHRVVVAQPGRVVVLDVRDASVTEVEVPDDTLLHAGWSQDGRHVVAWGHRRSWVVDPDTADVTRAPGPARPEALDLAEDAQGRTVLRAFEDPGLLTGERRLPEVGAEPYGQSAAMFDLAAGVTCFLDEALAGPLGRHQGVLAVADGEPSIPALVLAAAEDDAVPKAAYRPLRWLGPDRTLLLGSTSYPDDADGYPVIRVLAWDVLHARLWFVSELERPTGVWLEFTGDFAI